MSAALPCRRQRGFSIIEISVVLVVIGMLITAAIPNITSWLRNSHLRNQAEAVLTGLQQARNEAVRRNRSVGFWMVDLPTANAMNDECTVSATGTSWVVSLNDPSSHCSAAPSSTQSPRIVFKRLAADGSAGVSVSGVASDGAAAASVTFDGFGRAVAGGITQIDVSYGTTQDNDRPLRILVSTSGQARMCDVSVTDASDPRKCPDTAYQ